MGSTRLDLTGREFGRLTVLEYSHTVKKRVYWKCICECGARKTIVGTSLKSGHSRSCGCLFKETIVNRNKSHELAHSPEYVIWGGIKTRCHNSNAENYEYYGGRGISICPEWRDNFKKFLEDMGPRPSEEHSIDRIDNNGNYEPGNCRWVTRSEQIHNRRINRNNTSGIKGVHKKGNQWGAQITVNGTRHFLGAFSTIDEAARARKEAEIKFLGKSS